MSSDAAIPPRHAVLGAGTWGITLAALLAEKGLDVRAWHFLEEEAATMQRERTHPLLEDFTLPDGLVVTSSLADALKGVDTVTCVVPSHVVRMTCEKIASQGLMPSGAPFIIASKGIEEGTLSLMTEVAAQGLGSDVPLCVLSGPSHAEEVSKRIPTAVVSASEDPALAAMVQHLYMTDRFRVYTQGDVIGVELASALKNVIAIAAGVCAGLKLGDNTLAALITRGLAEISRLGKKLGAQTETFLGLAGIGDLVVTAMSLHSRNGRFGRLMAQPGMSVERAEAEIGQVVEGIRTARAAHALAQREQVHMPITQAVVALLDGRLSASEAISTLMESDPKPEIYMTLDDLK